MKATVQLFDGVPEITTSIDMNETHSALKGPKYQPVGIIYLLFVSSYHKSTSCETMMSWASFHQQ